MQDVSAERVSVQTRTDAVDILEVLLTAPGGNACDASGKDFIAALASMQQSRIRIDLMPNITSKAVVQLKKILRGIFMPDSKRCIFSQIAPTTFRLCRCLLAVEASPQLQGLVLQAFNATWDPAGPSAPNMRQVSPLKAPMYAWLVRLLSPGWKYETP